MNPIAAEASVVRNYLDWIFAIPWGKRARICKNLRKAETFLDENHYGLDKVKERILEFLAVQNVWIRSISCVSLALQEEFLWRWGKAVPLEKLGALRAVCGVWGVFCTIFEQEPGKLSLHRECGNGVASPFSVDEQSHFSYPCASYLLFPRNYFAQTRSFVTFFNFRLVFLFILIFLTHSSPI